MATQLQKLMFTMDLMDRVSGPAGKIQKTLGSVANAAQESFSKITAGFAGVAASGFALKALAGPAQEFNMAIGSVRSLDVAQESLDKLSNTAIKFSIKYGESAKDFVTSSYDIQSAIAGLTGNELASVTYASNVLAKATKADAVTITSYVGTMYKIFEESAIKMGRGKWMDQLAGKTATAVKIYKTTGGKMAEGFKALGLTATKAGISMAEQFAVLGNLQGVMDGGVSGTSYVAFINNAGKAQEKLGLKFTDSAGKMLQMPAILEKIQTKFGDLEKLKNSDALKAAFGTDEAVKLIKALISNRALIAKDITTFDKIKGLDTATKMAEPFVDSFQRLSKGIQAVRIGLGQALLPVLLPVVESMAEGAGAIYNWTQEYPNLTKWIGYAVVGIAGITGAVAAFTVMGGIASMTTLGYGNATKFAGHMTKLFSKESIIAKWAMAGWSLAMKFASGGMAILRGGLLAARTSFLWLNAAMYANPVGFVVAGVVALTAGVAAAIYYWDNLKKSFLDSSWGQAIMGWIDKILGGFKTLTGGWDWIKDKISWIPGMGDDPAGDIPKSSPSLDAPRRSAIIPGGASKSIASAVTNNSRSDSNSIHIGQVVTSRPINSQEISSMMAMAGA